MCLPNIVSFPKKKKSLDWLKLSIYLGILLNDELQDGCCECSLLQCMMNGLYFNWFEYFYIIIEDRYLYACPPLGTGA